MAGRSSLCQGKAMNGQDEERRHRLARALRDNLRRRKAQARGVPLADPAVGDRDRNGDRDEDSD
jgi:hypothetical protein